MRHAPAIRGLSALVASQPLQAWKDWLAFHQINHFADVLPTPIDQASFAFNGTALLGTPQQRERAKRGLDSLNVHLGDAVGRAYVERYFPASAREQVQGMVTNIKHAFDGVVIAPIPDSWWYHAPRLALQPVLVWWALFCSGVIDWPNVLRTAVECGVEEFYVEQEPPFTRPTLESARISFEYLKTLA